MRQYSKYKRFLYSLCISNKQFRNTTETTFMNRMKCNHIIAVAVVCEWTSSITPHHADYTITYTCWTLCNSLSVKGILSTHWAKAVAAIVLACFSQGNLVPRMATCNITIIKEIISQFSIHVYLSCWSFPSEKIQHSFNFELLLGTWINFNPSMNQ